MAKLKEMHSIGGMELNPDAEDFIPGNQQPRHLSLRNWARPEVHRNRTNNLPSARQQKFHRDYQHEHIQKRNSYNCPRNNFRAPVVCPEGQNNRNSANHSFQNQRRHRVIKHERPWDSDRDQIKQDSYKVVEGAEGPEENETFHCAASAEQNVAEKERPELALESERETNTDKHGARPKKINQPTYGSGRFSNDRGKLGLSRDIRTGEKWKEMPESTLAAGFTQLSTSGFVQDPPGKHQKPANYNEPKTHCYFGAKNVRESTWNQYNSDRESHRKQAFQHSKTEKGEKNISYTAISKPEVNKERETRPFSDKGPDLSSRSMTYRRAEAEKMSGHQHQPWDGLKKSFQSPRKPLWRKQMEVHKSKETHTGSLIEQLTSEKYECMVCCEIVRMMAPVWSCQNCYHVFHLNCIKKWARSPASQAEAEGNDGWRCPACQNVSARVPSSYTCFCGKVTNPEWNRNEIPHSCGELCGKKRSGMDCPHPCNILCHPGPCPPCPAFVTKACECGKTSQSVRCGHLGAIRCSSICDSLLNCGKHTCAVLCHAGKCQPCSVIVQQVCYCGTSSREVPCGTDKEHYDGTGYFSCHKPCGSKLNCGKHECIQECHPRPCLPCPRLPHIIRTCPCGQTSLAKLLELGCSERKSCTDPIPSCGKTCGKPLLCGSDDFVHTCENLCHEGECGSCSRTSTVSCRCGFRTKEIPCADIKNKAELTFMCDKRCSKKRLCGRHKCNEICCVDKEHKCSLICGRKLNCGLHRCEEPCHRGNCQTCWQTSFDELTCHCGETVIYPPVPCGTKPPECKNICTRHHECSHPVFHNCHSEEKCPPCTYLMKKWCMGKHEERNNIPCHLSDISCGLQCQKLLPCGMHKCKRICHKGDCITDVPCTQPCITPRSCGHPCEEPCHPRSPCPGKPCKAKVLLTCNCGHRKENMICCEASSTCQRIAAIAVASKLSDTQLGDSVEISRLVSNKEMKQARLQCNEECAALERNRRLAEALSIDTNSDPFNVRFTNSKYSDSLKEEARKDIKFLTEVEEEMRALVESVNKGKQTKRSHCFPPMKRDHRKLIHDLAEIYGIESVSYDSEPKRNVVVTAVKGRSSCPNPSLATVIERDQQMRPPPPIAHHKQATKNSSCTTSTIQKVLKEEPLIDYFDVQD